MAFKKVIWMGDSLKILKTFPERIQKELGHNLHRLQLAQSPRDSRPMKTIGVGVYELREQDNRHWYRVLYYIKFKGKIYVLHSFRKKTAKTSGKDISIALARLRYIKNIEN